MKIALAISTIIVALLFQWSLTTAFFNQQEGVVRIGTINIERNVDGTIK